MQVSVGQGSSGVVDVQLAGRVTAQAWHAALKDVAKLLKPEKRTPILLAAERFEGWERGDWDDLSFQREHDNEIARIAIVADEKWKDQVLMFAGQGLRKLDIRFFTPPEAAQARQWVSAGA
jgi:hypothetical protein